MINPACVLPGNLGSSPSSRDANRNPLLPKSGLGCSCLQDPCLSWVPSVSTSHHRRKHSLWERACAWAPLWEGKLMGMMGEMRSVYSVSGTRCKGSACCEESLRDRLSTHPAPESRIFSTHSCIPFHMEPCVRLLRNFKDPLRAIPGNVSSGLGHLGVFRGTPSMVYTQLPGQCAQAGWASLVGLLGCPGECLRVHMNGRLPSPAW